MNLLPLISAFMVVLTLDFPALSGERGHSDAAEPPTTLSEGYVALKSGGLKGKMPRIIVDAINPVMMEYDLPAVQNWTTDGHSLTDLINLVTTARYCRRLAPPQTPEELEVWEVSCLMLYQTAERIVGARAFANDLMSAIPMPPFSAREAMVAAWPRVMNNLRTLQGRELRGSDIVPEDG